MRIAVSNSSPLINLSIIKRFHLLYSFDIIHIPPAVWNEVVINGEGLPGCNEVKNGVKQGKIIVTPLSNPISVNIFRRVLHFGEAEAITLGMEILPTVIILDEHVERDEAIHLYILTIRTKYQKKITHQGIHMGDVEADIRVIKEGIQQLTRRMDLILEQRDTWGMMRLSDRSLTSFLSEEPDLYTITDCKVVHR